MGKAPGWGANLTIAQSIHLIDLHLEIVISAITKIHISCVLFASKILSKDEIKNK
jgi:hypothetical protein